MAIGPKPRGERGAAQVGGEPDQLMRRAAGLMSTLSVLLFTSMCLASPYSRREALAKRRTGPIAAELIPARALWHIMENDGPD